MNKNKKYISQLMKNIGMIPVFNHSDIEICKKVLDASYQGGVRVFEFTNRAENSLKVFTQLYTYAKKYDDLILGIGTLFTAQQAQQFIDAGADFIVSPALVEEVIEVSLAKNILCIPGCATLTEVYKAVTLGTPIVKAFPGNVLGPAFIKSVKSVLPKVEIMPTGGVKPTEDNLNSWFNAGVICVGMGSQLFNNKDIEAGHFEKLTADIKNTLQLIQQIKN